MGRTNFAPRMPTILVALALVVIGLLGTFGEILPRIGGWESTTIGAWVFVLACAVMLAGIIFEGI